MTTFNKDIATFNKEIGAKAAEAKAKLDELESHAKHIAHHNETQAITDAKKLHAKIESQREELATAGESKAAAIKTGIRGDISKLEAAIHNLHSKLHSTAKTS